MSSTTYRDEVEDRELAPAEWPGPGRPPLFVISTRSEAERAVAAEPVARLFPLGVTPARGDRWLDYGSGYGAFSILAARRGAELVVPVESDPVRAELSSKALYLEDAANVLSPATYSTSRSLAAALELYEITALRLGAGAPWLDLAELPSRISKVIVHVERRRVSIVRERAADAFSSVVSGVVRLEWLPTYVFAWGRR